MLLKLIGLNYIKDKCLILINWLKEKHEIIRKIKKTFQIISLKYLHSLLLDYIKYLKTSRATNLEEQKKNLLQ